MSESETPRNARRVLQRTSHPAPVPQPKSDVSDFGWGEGEESKGAEKNGSKDSADESSGRGVGLASLAAVCRDMEADITVDSKPGKGTTWRFRFHGRLANVPRERPITLEAAAVGPN